MGIRLWLSAFHMVHLSWNECLELWHTYSNMSPFHKNRKIGMSAVTRRSDWYLRVQDNRWPQRLGQWTVTQRSGFGFGAEKFKHLKFKHRRTRTPLQVASKLLWNIRLLHSSLYHSYSSVTRCRTMLVRHSRHHQRVRVAAVEHRPLALHRCQSCDRGGSCD